MTVDEIMKELESYGNEGTRKIYLKHGATEPIYGVKVGDMKKIQKKIKKNHDLSLELYKTNNGDAMYLAGLIADEKLISEKDLNNWVKKASWSMISEYCVPWVAAESNHGLKLGLQWINDSKEQVCAAGWSTLSSYLIITPDEAINRDQFSELIAKVENEIHQSANRVRYTMNNFLIACGSQLAELTTRCKEASKNIGVVKVDMGGTACKVPDPVSYIEKIEKMGRIGKKKKQARC